MEWKVSEEKYGNREEVREIREIKGKDGKVGVERIREGEGR